MPRTRRAPRRSRKQRKTTRSHRRIYGGAWYDPRSWFAPKTDATGLPPLVRQQGSRNLLAPKPVRYNNLNINSHIAELEGMNAVGVQDYFRKYQIPPALRRQILNRMIAQTNNNNNANNYNNSNNSPWAK